MRSKILCDFIVEQLENMKARDIRMINVTGRSSVADYMIICSGNSNRHVNSIAQNLVMETKQEGITYLGVEGLKTGEWVLIDLGEAVVHIMQDEPRDFYQLEKLWEPVQVEANL